MYDKIVYVVTRESHLSDVFIMNSIDRHVFRSVFGFAHEEYGVDRVNGLVFLVEDDGSLDAVGPGTCPEWYSIAFGYLSSQEYDDNGAPIPLNVSQSHQAVPALHRALSSAREGLFDENPIAIVHVDKEREFLGLMEGLHLASYKVAEGKPLEEIVHCH